MLSVTVKMRQGVVAKRVQFNEASIASIVKRKIAASITASIAPTDETSSSGEGAGSAAGTSFGGCHESKRLKQA